MMDVSRETGFALLVCVMLLVAPAWCEGRVEGPDPTFYGAVVVRFPSDSGLLPRDIVGFQGRDGTVEGIVISAHGTTAIILPRGQMPRAGETVAFLRHSPDVRTIVDRAPRGGVGPAPRVEVEAEYVAPRKETIPALGPSFYYDGTGGTYARYEELEEVGPPLTPAVYYGVYYGYPSGYRLPIYYRGYGYPAGYGQPYIYTGRGYLRQIHPNYRAWPYHGPQIHMPRSPHPGLGPRSGHGPRSGGRR
jgi:hypothetical protein